MKRRHQQQIVESERAPYPQVRYPRQETSPVRWSLVLALIVLGVLIIGGAILGILSLIDLIAGHPAVSWHHFTAWVDSIKGWLLAGGIVVVVAKVVLPLLELRAQTALPRAEAAIKRAEARRIHKETVFLEDLHYHNLDNLPATYLVQADEYGNYPQMIGPDGRPVGFLLPGNAGQSTAASGVSAQFLRDWMEAQRSVESDEPLQIEGLEEEDSVDPRTVEAATLEQDLAAGSVSQDAPARLGYRIVLDEFNGTAHLEPIDDPDDAPIFVCAGTTAGKSTLVASLMARMAARGDTVFVGIDPHKNNPERSIAAKILPALEAWLAYPVVWGKDPKEVKGVVKFLRELITLRQGPDKRAKERHRLHGLKVRVIVDEALALAAMTRKPDHDKAYDELMFLLQEMATETAKDEIIHIALAQIATKAQMGDVDIRDVCPKTIILKTPKQSGLALNLPAEMANMAHFFPRGRGFYIGEADEPELFIWGYASTEAIAKLASIATSPLQPDTKLGGNRLLNLVSRQEREESETGYEESETGWKPDGNRVGNQFPPALQAELEKIVGWEGKLDRLKGVLGEDLADVVYPTVWEVKPGRSELYQKAREEYKVLMAAVRWQLEHAS